MSNQILISSGAKLRDLDDVIIGTDGVLSSLGFNVANGVPKLDENGKILVSQLPNSVMEFKGVWDAATNTPTLANGTGNAGDVYLCNVAGTVNFGAGPITFAVGDYAVYTGTVWARSSGATGTVTSVGLSKDGDALAITGSPITTSGTINIGFTGTNLQYINGAGNLTTFPILTGFVPYTGATQNVDLGTYGLLGDFLQLNTSPTSVPTAVGTVSWDNFYRTMQIVTGDGDTTLQVGQEQVTLIHNNTGSTLTDGQVVYVTGSTGELPTVALASNTTEATSSVTFGVVTESIANGADGFITTSGMVHGLNTLAFNEGDALYLGATAGTFTNVKPTAPNNLVLVGYMIKKAGGNGSIFVKIQNGYELEELHDVLITSVADGDILQWNSATSLWENVAGSTTNIAEGSNLYFTDARARAAISLTTTGSTGPATYNSTTGVLNIPNYVDQYVGTVTSVGLSAPTGFSVSGSPVTSSGTLALSFASGYSLPTNVKQSNWDDAYTWVAAFPTQTGNSGKFLTTDGSTLSWATVIAGVQSVTASSPLFSSGGANPNITIQVATTSQNGYLSSTDWNTFNSKQNALTNPVTGTGTTNNLPKFTGTSTIGDSLFTDNGTNGGFGGTNYSSGTGVRTFNITAPQFAGVAFWTSSGYTGDIFAYESTGNLIITADPQNLLSASNVILAVDGTNIATLNTTSATFSRPILIGTTPASVSSGLSIGIPNNNAIRWRNAANTGDLGFYLSTTNQFTFDSSINVNGEAIITGGISGTSLTLYDNTNSALLKLRRDAGQQRGALQFGRTNGDVAQIVGDSDTTSLNNGVMSFWTTNGSGTMTSNMWIKGGNLLVGTSTDAGYKLDVNGKGRFKVDGLSVFGFDILNNNGNRGIGVYNTGGSNLQMYFYDNSNAEKIVFDSSNGSGSFVGDVTSSTGFQGRYYRIREASAARGGMYTFNVISGGGTDYSLGLFSEGQMYFAPNGNAIKKMMFDSSGNLFVNTTSGVSGGGALQVNGNVNINGVFQINGTTIGGGGGSGVTGSGTTNYIPLWTGSTSLGNSLIKQNDGAEIQIQYSPTQGQLRIGGGNGAGNSRVYIESNGNNSYLDNYGDNTYKNFQIAVNNLKLTTGGAHTATFTSSNILSIGSETPNYASRLFVFHNNNNAYNPNGFNGSGLISIQGGNSTSNYTTLRLAGGGSCEFLLGIFQDSGGLANFVFQNYNGSNYGEIMRFAPNRNILIGTTTDNGYKINLNGSISFAYGFLSIFRGSSGAGDIFVGNDGSRIYIGGNTYVAGNVTATGGFFDTSDSRLKTLVEDNYLLSSIANVKAKLYKKDGRMELGYYAQDLEAILPSAVKEGADGFLSLSYAQVHTAKIAVIEDEVTILKNRVSELEKQLNLN